MFAATLSVCITTVLYCVSTVTSRYSKWGGVVGAAFFFIYMLC